MFGRPVQRRDGAAGGLHSSFIQLKLAAAAIVAVVAGPTASAATAAAAELSSMSSNELLMDLLLLAAAGCCCCSSSTLQQQAEARPSAAHTAQLCSSSYCSTCSRTCYNCYNSCCCQFQLYMKLAAGLAATPCGTVSTLHWAANT